MKKIFHIILFFLLLTFIFILKNNISNNKVLRIPTNLFLLNSETPLKDLTTLAEININNTKIVNYIYEPSNGKFYENIYFDLSFDSQNKLLNLKKILFQGVGTLDTKCWTYIEELNIPIRMLKDNSFSYDLIDNKTTCIDDYNGTDKLTTYLNFDDYGRLKEKRLIGTKLQKNDKSEKPIILMYRDKNKLLYEDKVNSQYLHVEKHNNMEIYKDKNNNIIKVYTAIVSYSKKYKRNIINKIVVKDDKNKIIKTIILEYY